MNVYDNYKYPINEIASARESKDWNRLKFYLKDYKRLEQGLVKTGMWHTEEQEDWFTEMCGYITYKKNQQENRYVAQKDKRR